MPQCLEKSKAMIRVKTALVYIANAVIGGLPAAAIIASLFGCGFILASYPAYAVLCAVTALIMLVAAFVPCEEKINKVTSVFSALLPFTALISMFMLLLKSMNAVTVIAAIICFLCCFFAAAGLAYPLGLKIASLASAATLTCACLYIGFYIYIFSGIVSNTVVKSVESPSGKYVAEVIDSDQGALGGDTLVEVRRKNINLIVAEIKGCSRQIYIGEWGEFENISVYWIDDDHVIVNNREYKI